jgi:hypothetical protein
MMNNRPVDFGPQYAGDGDFKARARLHQSRFRVESLGLPDFADYGSRLGKADALAGHNFYWPWEGLFAGVQARYTLGYKKVYWDMLGSDHIPFNFFLPLRDEPALASALLSHLLGEAVTTTRIEVEWPLHPKQEYLDDSTSFDVFIAYGTEKGAHGAVGVEVKYTEGEYGWGATERKQMLDDGSLYNQVHRKSGICVDGAQSGLRTRRLKQVWRNQLLGEAMLQHAGNKLARFTSVLLYPRGNSHFAAVASEYQQLLRPERATRFVALTYESFIAFFRAQGSSPKVSGWRDYLERRYIVSG